MFYKFLIFKILALVSYIIVATFLLDDRTQELSKNNHLNTTTIISVYFPFSSKHSKHAYDQWIKNFVNSVSSPLAIFTDESSKGYILKLRPDLKFHAIFYLYENAAL